MERDPRESRADADDGMGRTLPAWVGALGVLVSGAGAILGVLYAPAAILGCLVLVAVFAAVAWRGVAAHSSARAHRAGGTARRPVLLRPRAVVPLLLATALAFFLHGALRAAWIELFARWPTTPGVVVSAEVARSLVLEDGRGAQHKAPAFRERWGVEAAYRYQVGLVSYAGDRVRPRVFPWKTELLGEGTRPEAKEGLRSYPPGRAVTVTYNPHDPQEAYLDVRTGAVLPATLALLVVWAALMAARYASRTRPRGRVAPPPAAADRSGAGREGAALLALTLEYVVSLIAACVLLGVAARSPDGAVGRTLHEEMAFLLGAPALVVAAKVAAGGPRRLLRRLRGRPTDAPPSCAARPQPSKETET